MGRQKKTQPCPECGGEMRYEKHDDVLSYKEKTKTLETLGWWCAKCGEGILSGDALVAHEKAFLEFKAQVDDVLNPREVAAVREKLGLSQRKAGELLGGGPRAFQKYEAGSQAVSAPMSNLLRLLANEPSRLDEIKLAKGGATSKPKRSPQAAVARKKPGNKRTRKAAAPRSARSKKRATG